MRCRKCDKEFVEARDRFPSDICPACFNAQFICTSTFLAQPDKTCGKVFSGNFLDPTLGVPGLNFCVACRDSYCHQCGKLKEMHLDLCKRCKANKAFCSDCSDSRTGKKCLTQSQKIAPIYLDPIKYTPLGKSTLPCQKGIAKPLFFADGSEYYPVKLFTAHEAEDYTRSLFSTLVMILARGDFRGGAFLPPSQNTLAIALLGNADHYKIILTYSDYDSTHVSTVIKKDHDTFQRAVVINVFPLVIYNKSQQKHSISRLATSASSSSSSSSSAPTYEYTPYVLAENNDHHAEMRALNFCQIKEYELLLLMPTKECCGKCKGRLLKEGHLKCVPPHLQSNIPNVGDNWLKGDGDEQKFSIQKMPGGGNCFFSCFVEHVSQLGGRSGALESDFFFEVPPGQNDVMSMSNPAPRNDAINARLRSRVALAVNGLSAERANSIMTENSYIDTHDIETIAGVFGFTVVLYEAHYGEDRWYQKSVFNENRARVYILLRSVRGESEGHYDLLVPSPPEDANQPMTDSDAGEDQNHASMDSNNGVM